jgi:hypothetical protein
MTFTSSEGFVEFCRWFQFEGTIDTAKRRVNLSRGLDGQPVLPKEQREKVLSLRERTA